MHVFYGKYCLILDIYFSKWLAVSRVELSMPTNKLLHV